MMKGRVPFDAVVNTIGRASYGARLIIGALRCWINELIYNLKK